MQVFVNKSGESKERPASPSVSQKSFNGCSPPSLCSTPKASTSVEASNTPTNITVTEDVRNTDNDADNLEDQGSLSEVSNSASNVETEYLHPDNDMDKFSE